jgi:hypothetical protein
MRIFDKLEESEIELLDKAGIFLNDIEYSSEEVEELRDQIMEKVMECTDENFEFTQEAEEFKKIHDKLVEF